MFALEIEFSDGISLPETIFLRRTSAILGSSETAHVFIESQSNLPDIRITRGLGREFRSDVVRRPSDADNITSPSGLTGTFTNRGEIQFGGVLIRIIALDVDLILEGDEAPDVAAIRVLRTALNYDSPLYPAISVLGGAPVLLSFSPRSPIKLGRARSCLLRFESSDVSAEHVQIGCDDGQCWVEDLGSTNGTLVSGEKISERTPITADSVISIGSEITFSLLLRPEDMSRLQNRPSVQAPPQRRQAKYPVIFSNDDNVRPSRFVLTGTGKLTVGRDPANDIWINAPHISRCHLQFEWTDDGRMRVLDESSNGTSLEGDRLERGVPLDVLNDVRTIELGGGVELYIARSESEEQAIRDELDSRAADEKLSAPQDAIKGQYATDGSPFAAVDPLSPPTMMATKTELPVIDRDEDDLEDSEMDDDYEYPAGRLQTRGDDRFQSDGYNNSNFVREVFDRNEFNDNSLGSNLFEDPDPSSRSSGFGDDEYHLNGEGAGSYKESEQFQLLEEADEPLGLGASFSRVLLFLLIVLLTLFSGLVFLGFFADKYFY